MTTTTQVRGLRVVVDNTRPDIATDDVLRRLDEALGLIERFTFQVVVSDFQMPKMNGIQFLSEVRLRSPVTKRLMVSGSPDAERLNAKEKIAHRVLAKPLDVGELISTVNSLAEVDDEPA